MRLLGFLPIQLELLMNSFMSSASFAIKRTAQGVDLDSEHYRN